MLLILSLLACSSQSVPFVDAEMGENCEVVSANSEDIPTTWGAAEVSEVLARVPSGLAWTYGGPAPEGLGDAALSLTVEPVAFEWIVRQGSMVGSHGCRAGVELAVDAEWTVNLENGEAVASGRGTLYAASAEADGIYLDVLELSGEISEDWETAAEESLSAEYGWNLFAQEFWILIDGTWSKAEVAVEGKFVSETTPEEGPRTVLGMGSWSF